MYVGTIDSTATPNTGTWYDHRHIIIQYGPANKKYGIKKSRFVFGLHLGNLT